MAGEGRINWARWAARCESVIERRLFWALVGHPRFAAGEIEPADSIPAGCPVQLFVQKPVLDLRVDFLIVARGPRSGLEGWVVEADGYEFHDRTKFKAEADRARDRRLIKLGYRVMRFAGSEINRDPDMCAEEVWDCIAAACGWEGT